MSQSTSRSSASGAWYSFSLGNPLKLDEPQRVVGMVLLILGLHLLSTTILLIPSCDYTQDTGSLTPTGNVPAGTKYEATVSCLDFQDWGQPQLYNFHEQTALIINGKIQKKCVSHGCSAMQCLRIKGEYDGNGGYNKTTASYDCESSTSYSAIGPLETFYTCGTFLIGLFIMFTDMDLSVTRRRFVGIIILLCGVYYFVDTVDISSVCPNSQNLPFTCATGNTTMIENIHAGQIYPCFPQGLPPWSSQSLSPAVGACQLHGCRNNQCLREQMDCKDGKMDPTSAQYNCVDLEWMSDAQPLPLFASVGIILCGVIVAFGRIDINVNAKWVAGITLLVLSMYFVSKPVGIYQSCDNSDARECDTVKPGDLSHKHVYSMMCMDDGGDTYSREKNGGGHSPFVLNAFPSEDCRKTNCSQCLLYGCGPRECLKLTSNCDGTGKVYGECERMIATSVTAPITLFFHVFIWFVAMGLMYLSQRDPPFVEGNKDNRSPLLDNMT
eukprot:GFYU01003526.1.p1 GENE.GFYU01003526.1~~GFYU01003526.1.p1  ORF type:complete len:562 (-),score=149.20 GFYU01003526.1:328-1815(-)